MHSYYFVFPKIIIFIIILSLFSCAKKKGTSSSSATASSQTSSCTPKRMIAYKSDENQKIISKKIKLEVTDRLAINKTLTASSSTPSTKRPRNSPGIVLLACL